MEISSGHASFVAGMMISEIGHVLERDMQHSNAKSLGGLRKRTAETYTIPYLASNVWGATETVMDHV